MGRRFAIKSSERVVAVGKTGSGKSYLTRYLVRPLPRLIVCDSKGEIGEGNNRELWRLQDFTERRFSALLRGRPGRLRVPPQDGDDWTGYLRRFLGLRNCVIQIDELNQLGAAAQGDDLRSLFTRGRSRGIGVVACTQRPAWVPRESMTEAEHYFIFQVKAQSDNDRIYEFVGDAGFGELERWGYRSFVELQRYQFLYYNDPERVAQFYQRLDVKGGNGENGN